MGDGEKKENRGKTSKESKNKKRPHFKVKLNTVGLRERKKRLGTQESDLKSTESSVLRLFLLFFVP